MNDTTPLETTPDPTTRRRFSARPIVIGAVTGIAVLGLGIGGFALADTLDDANDDDRVVITSGDTPVAVPSGEATNGADPSPSFSNDDDDRPISEQEYAEVSAAALAATGGGTVTELKRDDDPGKAWEVEVRLDNGDDADVELDADLTVLRIDLDRHND